MTIPLMLRKGKKKPNWAECQMNDTRSTHSQPAPACCLLRCSVIETKLKAVLQEGSEGVSGEARMPCLMENEVPVLGRGVSVSLSHLSTHTYTRANTHTHTQMHMHRVLSKSILTRYQHLVLAGIPDCQSDTEI